MLKKQIPRFLVVGSSAVACDFLLYFALIQILSHSVAKTLSFLGGTVLAYFLNKHWTFEKRDKSHVEMAYFLLLYLSTLGINVIVNKISLDFQTSTLIAFLMATGTSTVLNFCGQKWWVFK